MTETNYCITLDRVPDSLYPQIAANEAQREEWVKLFAIDEIMASERRLGRWLGGWLLGAPHAGVPKGQRQAGAGHPFL
ncbi:MAG: hypothetical protein IPK50_17750 [Fibrobacterota bacterium]|nr:MAG: hypothetical protein IPK50_17750 [Fibrobacterota bacterium]